MQMVEKPIKAVLFDLGYTLINFRGDLTEVARSSYAVLTEALIAKGCKLDRDAFAERFRDLMVLYYAQREIDLLELPVHSIVRRALEEFDQSCVDEKQITASMHSMYKVTEKNWHLEEDTLDTLMILRDRGYTLGMITNASDAWDVNNLIDMNHLRGYFSTVLISAEEGIRKPDRRIFEKAARLMQLEPAQMVMVGDTLTADILGAKGCGMKAVWISRRAESARYQMRVRPELTPNAEIKTLTELPDLLETFE